MDADARQIIGRSAGRDHQHPVTAVWHVVIEGSLTARGGVVAAVGSVRVIDLGNGQMIRIAVKGDAVTYTDGSSARTVSGTDQKATHFEKGPALMGSVLDNGDETVLTPQDRLVLLPRKGMTGTPDFLAVPGDVVHGVSS